MLVLFRGVSGLLSHRNASPPQRVRCGRLYSATCVSYAVPSVTIGPCPRRADLIRQHALPPSLRSDENNDNTKQRLQAFNARMQL